MKRLWSVLIFTQVLLFAPCLWAQTAKIVEVKGKVQVKETPSAEWQKAKINMMLEKDAEVQTQKKSQCTLAFDEELKNILTVKENSHIKLENVSPGKVFLPEGRVFTLIESLAKAETFQVRTPTAIAGARGTGWMTGFTGGVSTALCFTDKIFTNCPDQTSGEKDVNSGYGLEITEGCTFSNIFPIGDKEWREWDDFVEDVGVLRGEITVPGDDDGGSGDLQDEQKDDFSDFSGEGRRADEETPPYYYEGSRN